jgi:hypothetical protein
LINICANFNCSYEELKLGRAALETASKYTPKQAHEKHIKEAAEEGSIEAGNQDRDQLLKEKSNSTLAEDQSSPQLADDLQGQTPDTPQLHTAAAKISDKLGGLKDTLLGSKKNS